MSSAIKCDRCGNYFDKFNSKRRIGGLCVIGIRMFTADGDCNSYDLCENCVEDLYAFMNLNKKEEKT